MELRMKVGSDLWKRLSELYASCAREGQTVEIDISDFEVYTKENDHFVFLEVK